MLDWAFKLLELFQQGKAQWALVIVILALFGVIAWMERRDLRKADRDQRQELKEHERLQREKVDEHREKLREHSLKIETHEETLRDLKRDQSERFSRITQEIRETKMSNDASIKLLAYQLQTVEKKVEDLSSKIEEHSESREQFQKYVYERMGRFNV